MIKLYFKWQQFAIIFSIFRRGKFHSPFHMPFVCSHRTTLATQLYCNVKCGFCVQRIWLEIKFTIIVSHSPHSNNSWFTFDVHALVDGVAFKVANDIIISVTHNNKYWINVLALRALLVRPVAVWRKKTKLKQNERKRKNSRKWKNHKSIRRSYESSVRIWGQSIINMIMIGTVEALAPSWSSKWKCCTRMTSGTNL